jgi:hypothetical protein
VTSSLLSPRRRHSCVVGTGGDGATDATPILDWQSPEISALIASVGPTDDGRQLLREAHHSIAHLVRPIYALNDEQPASRTLTRRYGSCSQRLALLEAVARGSGIRTRVHGLVLDGRFWYPRFPRFTRLVPDRVILAWPDFHLDATWVSASELFGTIESLAQRAEGFTNTPGETLFDAVGRTAIDWYGSTSSGNSCSVCDLSGHVVADLGLFDSRDELFTANGQTICPTARTVVGPALERLPLQI